VSRAQARLASKAAQVALEKAIPLPGVSEVADVSRKLGAAYLAREGITDIPSVLEFLGPGPGGAVAIDVLGIGEKVSAGDIVRLQTRLRACEGQLRSFGAPLALGILPGAQLNTITDALVHAQHQRRTPKAVKAIRAADAIVKGAGYAGLLDPRLKQPGGLGGPAFQKLQRVLGTL
jgi:hypothetical protein